MERAVIVALMMVAPSAAGSQVYQAPAGPNVALEAPRGDGGQRPAVNAFSFLSVPGASGMAPPDLVPPVQKAAPEGRIADGSRFGAIIVSSMMGLGIGHYVIGFPKHASAFLGTQLGGLGLMLLAFGSGEGAAFYGGLALYTGSRVWEFVDVIIRPAVHNARLDEAASTRARGGPRSVVRPLFLGDRQGVAVTFRF